MDRQRNRSVSYLLPFYAKRGFHYKILTTTFGRLTIRVHNWTVKHQQRLKSLPNQIWNNWRRDIRSSGILHSPDWFILLGLLGPLRWERLVVPKRR